MDQAYPATVKQIGAALHIDLSFSLLASGTGLALQAGHRVGVSTGKTCAFVAGRWSVDLDAALKSLQKSVKIHKLNGFGTKLWMGMPRQGIVVSSSVLDQMLSVPHWHFNAPVLDGSGALQHRLGAFRREVA